MNVLIRSGIAVGGPEEDTAIVDSSDVPYGRNGRGEIVIPRCRHDDESSVVTTANGFTGDVLWIGGNRIKVTNRKNKIKISFDSDAEDESPWDSEESSPCSHPGDSRGGNEGGVSPDEEEPTRGAEHDQHEGGGVPSGSGVHIGDDPCCGPR